ncbi:MAG TPA: hypothetical protein VNU95_14515 [Candidatus Acidoferrales bacterium]|jgi:hypothetical protein|nr:hypothetical protein [Candidatus Acidoferrales bacterium]
MKPSLVKKLKRIRENPSCREFIIADARDADMAWGVPSPGKIYPPIAGGAPYRTMPQFREQIRAIVVQGAVDIMLASISTMSLLAHRERLFDSTEVTPAVRINDTSDVWCPRGGRYREQPSAPFASGFIEEAQYGSLTAEHHGEPVVNLGLYSITFNNHLAADRESLLAFKEFRVEAQRKNFNYFLEVFAPNVDAGLRPEEIPAFVNDSVCRMLAGVPLAARPVFLKIPYFGPRALEELVAYDPTVTVGILGGGSGTTYDAFKLLADAQKYGARVALFGRKIKEAEDPLIFISYLRRIANGEISPEEAVKAYHGELQTRLIPPLRSLEDDLKLTQTTVSYGKSR